MYNIYVYSVYKYIYNIYKYHVHLEFYIFEIYIKIRYNCMKNSGANLEPSDFYEQFSL